MRKKEKAMGLVKRCNEFTGEEMRDVQLLGLPLSKHELITISCVFISFVQVSDSGIELKGNVTEGRLESDHKSLGV